MLVHLARAADLQDPALVHDDDAVGKTHRLLLVVRHVDRRHTELELLRTHELAQLEALLGVERAERLIHEIDRGRAHDRAREGHSLLIAAGKLARVPAEERRDSQPLGHARHRGVPLARPEPRAPQRKGDVLGHREMRIESVELEHEADVARGGARARHVPAAEQDAALARLLQAGDHAQGGRLPAARGTQ